MFDIHRVELDWGGRKLTLETGRMARQADGAVLAKYGETTVLAAVVAAKQPKEGIDFLPLTVNYTEKYYAAGRIPGGYFKRERGPTEKDTLTSRLIDRPIRPLFADGWRCDTQVTVTVLSHDMENDPDIVAMVAASAALTISGAPFMGPIGGARVGFINNEYVLNPSLDEMPESQLDLVIAGTQDAVMMVESEAKELSEEIMLGAVMFGHRHFQPVIEAIIKLAEKAAKEPRESLFPTTRRSSRKSLGSPKKTCAPPIRSYASRTAKTPSFRSTRSGHETGRRGLKPFWSGSRSTLNLAPRPLLDTQIAFTMARAIQTAAELELFEALGKGAATCESVASACNTDPTATKKLLDCLVGIGYLRWGEGEYSLVQGLEKWLLRDSPNSLVAKLAFQNLEWDLVGKSSQFVRTGVPLDFHQNASAEDWAIYQDAMRDIAASPAVELAKRLPVPKGATRLLDIGGSHGLYSCELCKRHPALTATILELPGAVDRASEIAAREGLGDRVQHRTGDALNDDLGEATFDIVMVNNLIHHFTPRTKRRTRQTRRARALSPGDSTRSATFCARRIPAPAGVSRRSWISTSR